MRPPAMPSHPMKPPSAPLVPSVPSLPIMPVTARATPAQAGPRRRSVLLLPPVALASAAVTASAALAAASVALPAWATPARGVAVPRMGDGPFYPPARWRERWPDWDFDLTRVQRPGAPAAARGEHLGLGLVLQDPQGRAIDNALVEIWQCDAAATYHHPRVVGDDLAQPSTPQIDRGFAGYGQARSHTDGRVAFKTIRPVPYPGRTPHIHIKLSHPSWGSLSSQLFVAGDAGNAGDFLWRQLTATEQAHMAMQLQPAAADGTGLRWQVAHLLRVGS
jgi:protocatechuate 3,4-dioxygenase, beta subunit